MTTSSCGASGRIRKFVVGAARVAACCLVLFFGTGFLLCSEDLVVHLRYHRPGVLGCQMHIAGHDTGFPAADSFELLFCGTRAREVSGRAVAQIVEPEIGYLGCLQRHGEVVTVVVALSLHTYEHSIIVGFPCLASILRKPPCLAVLHMI